MNHFWEAGVQYLEETLNPALERLEIDPEPVWEFHAPSGGIDGDALRRTSEETLQDAVQGSPGDPGGVPVCSQCGASASERVLLGKRFCDTCYANDFKAFVRTAVKRFLTGARVFTAPDIPSVKLKKRKAKMPRPR